MGAASSCKIFETFSTAIEWIIQRHIPNTKVLHVLDDFLFISNSKQDCQKALDIFLEISKDIGVPIAPDKTVSPTLDIIFLGIQLNTQTMRASIPHDKVIKFNGIIDQFLMSKSVTLKRLQSLTGMLNFTCSIITPGRAFSRRLYNLSKGVTRPYHHIHITREVKEDLFVWKKFLLSYNRQTFFLDYLWSNNNVLQLYTDASTSVGFGGIFQNRWFAGSWDSVGEKLHINILELYPITVAINMWGHLIKNRCINLISDNLSVVYILNSFTSKDNHLMTLLRHLVLDCMKHNILIKATHIRSHENLTADLLSRGQVHKALQVAPHLDKKGTTVPSHLHINKLLNI